MSPDVGCFPESQEDGNGTFFVISSIRIQLQGAPLGYFCVWSGSKKESTYLMFFTREPRRVSNAVLLNWIGASNKQRAAAVLATKDPTCLSRLENVDVKLSIKCLATSAPYPGQQQAP